MKEKIFLTSALAMGFVAPVFAEPSNTGEFPSTGLMQEDYTYTNAATADNMDSVYEGTVNAVAEYDIIDYIVNAGQYLPADSETVITCPAGSYCPGISGNVQYNQSSDQGIQTCPTGYANSADGASSDTQCYRQCSGNVTIEHATGVTGNDYYGNGVDTCEPTGCVNGWHLKSGISGSELATAIGTGEGENSAYISANGTFDEKNHDGQGAKGQAYYGLTDNNTWAVYYANDKGMLTGQARCSTQAGDNNGYTWTNPTITANLTDETGQEGAGYCYCNVTGYTPNGGTMQAVLSSWVFRDYYGGSNGASSCARSCANLCASYMSYTYSGSNALAFRAAVVGSVQPGLAMCEANVININWNDVDPEYAGQNNEGTATYGSDVRTPVKAATKKGQTFRGWRFSKPEQTDLP